MPASEWYKRQKNKLKRAWGSESGSTTLSNRSGSNASTSTGPVPRAAENTANKQVEPVPGLDSSVSTPPIELSSNLPIETGTVASSTGSTPTVNNTRIDTTAVPIPKSLPEEITKFEEPEKKVTWSGLNALSRAQTFDPLNSAVKGLERSIGIFERASQARDDYRKLGERLDQLLGDLAEFNSNWMTTSVRNLCGRIEAEIKILEEKQPKRGPERNIQTIEDSDAILECYRRIHGHVERLMFNAKLDMWKIIDEEMTSRHLLQLSPNISGAYKSWASDRAQQHRCAKGTRTGKTTIAHTLCDELESTGEIAASFFCTQLIPECRNIRFIIPAIAYQLAQFSHPFRHALSKALESDPAAHTRELEPQFRTLITRPMNVVKHTLPRRFVVVVDALDECDDSDNIGKLLDLLITSTSDLPLRLLVFSRPEPEIYRRIMDQVGDSKNAKLVLHELDQADIQRDIELYLRQELCDLSLKKEQWGGLVKHCGILFIYASMACRYIKSSSKIMSHEEAVEAVLGLPLKGTRNMEHDLDNLYFVILEAAFKAPNISEENRKRMKTILDTIICGQWPMTTLELAGLLGLKDAEHASTLLHPLFSVVNVKDLGFASIFHRSFRDFMLSPDRSASFHCQATRHNIQLTKACLHQIRSYPLQFNICGIESSYILDDEIVDLSERVLRAISPALFYACCHWTTHLELGGQSAEVRDLVLDFLSARLLLWMEVLNLKGFIRNGEDCMKRAENWCREARMPKESIELAHDAWDFVSVYANNSVQKSTPHIYTSMLPFWPSTYPIAKHYFPRLTGISRPTGSAIDRRYLPRIAYRYMGETMRAVAYSPDGSQIAAAVGYDVYILDGWTGQTILGPLYGHTDIVSSIAVSPNGLYIASGSYDGTIRVWDAKGGKLFTGPFKTHRDRVTSVAFSPDGTRIVSTGAFDALQIWSVQSGEHKISISPKTNHTKHFRAAVFSSDGSRIISGDCNKAICFWDAQTGNLLSEQLEGHSDCINSVALSSDGSQLISASGDSTICVWDMTTQQVTLGPLQKHFGVNQAILSPSNLYIASCGGDDAVHLWDTRSGKEVLFEKHCGEVNSVSFSPEGSRLVSCSEDGSVCIWIIRHTDEDDGIFRTYYNGIRSACFSSDGSQIVTGGEYGCIYLWDAHSGELVRGPLTGHTGYICSVAISSDGSCIASASGDKTIRLWDLKEGKCSFRVLEHHTRRPDTLRFTPDNSHLFYGALLYSVGISSSASKVAAGPRGGTRDEWAAEIPRYSPENHVSRNRDKVSCIENSPDGSYVASGSADGTIRLWHARNGQLILGPLSGHTTSVSRIMFSPNGSHFATCSLDHTMRLWPIPGRPTGKVIDSGASDTQKEANSTISPTSRWKLRSDGWIMNERNEFLAWVPVDLHGLYLYEHWKLMGQELSSRVMILS
ncbi:hypothetical protein OPQ81_000571 [Rhizoctonia solani]|nr:hypothetical protein OPQ81_000571 [Rhizoctonia solani]